MENTEEMTSKQAEKIFWEKLHKVCLDCTEECKQSSKVISLKCINFNKKI